MLHFCNLRHLRCLAALVHLAPLFTIMFRLLALLLAFTAASSNGLPFDFSSLTTNGYVNVRPNAHMFWWFFHASKLTPNGFVKQAHTENFPIIIWLQGGPGGSSTGFGAFELIGPLDDDFQIRNTTWIQYANLLFIDNPVGTGFSYVTSQDAFATNNAQIADDLIVVLQHFFTHHPFFQNSPLYIFSESYGGKMAVSLTIRLAAAIHNHKLKCNLKGLVLGDPWISPIDSVSTWPNYLKALSLVDEREYEDLTIRVNNMKDILRNGHFKNATKEWSKLEAVIRRYTFNSDFYNVLKRDPVDQANMQSFIAYQSSLALEPDLFRYKLGEFYEEKLNDLMNTKVSSMLGIPNEVVWGSQIRSVFDSLSGDFMKPVLDEVNDILNNLPIKVVVYNGQWDLIVNVLGTQAWVNCLKFTNSDKFKQSQKKIIVKNNEILGFYKTYDKFSFYWILNSGHMAPRDAAETMLMLLQNILQN